MTVWKRRAGRSLLIGALCAGCAVILGCDEDAPTQPATRPLRFESVYSTPFSGIRERRGEVVRDLGRWSAVWVEIHAQSTPRPPLPPVDFDREMVLVAASGPHPSSCFELQIGSVVGGGREIAVGADVVAHPDCVCLAVVIYPVHVVRAERVDGTARFDFRERTSAGCP